MNSQTVLSIGQNALETTILLSAPPSAELRIISRAGLLPRQGECRDEHLGALPVRNPSCT